MTKYLILLVATLGSDAAALAAADDACARIVALRGGTRTRIPDYPDDADPSRNATGLGRGYGVAVQSGDQPALTPAEVAALVDELPADGDRAWGSTGGP